MKCELTDRFSRELVKMLAGLRLEFSPVSGLRSFGKLNSVSFTQVA